MAYLLIPIVSFVLLAGLSWVLFMPLESEKVRKGQIDDLDLVLSVLMTAAGDGLYLLMKVPGHLTSVKMTFPDSVVRLELPLVTQRQQSRKESYLALLGDLGLDAGAASQDSDHETLEWEVEGSPAEAAAVIKEAFSRLFEVDPGRALEFRVFAHLLDQNVIDQGLNAKHRGDKAELPTAATQGGQAEASEEERAGCMTALAGVLLLPVPFMVAYLEYGYIAASAVLVAYLVLREAYRRWKRSKRGFRVADFVKITILLLTGTTIYFNDPFYLQLVPTIVLSVVAVAEFLAVSFNLPHLSAMDPKDPDHSRTGRLLMSFAIIATCLGGAATNEYLRASLTLNAWVWWFAFFRIELVLGFLVTSIPFVYYMVKRIPRADGGTESP